MKINKINKLSVKSTVLNGKSVTKIDFIGGDNEFNTELAVDVIDYQLDFMPESEPWKLVHGDNKSLYIEAYVDVTTCINFLNKHLKGEFKLVD